MKNNFNDLNWHDAELQSVHIDRSNAGEKDEIVIVVCWPDESRDEITFHNCYSFEAQMNFGIIALESILSAEYTETSDKIDEIKRTWGRSGADFSNIGQYTIETNSTKSNLIICARNFSMKKLL